jgi:hypothetical protein
MLAVTIHRRPRVDAIDTAYDGGPGRSGRVSCGRQRNDVFVTIAARPFS